MSVSNPRPHILAINHSPEVLDLLRELLEEESFRVSTRSHLDRTIDDIATIAPDLILLDYPWNAEDNKWTLLQLLKMDRRTVHIPIVLCTGAVREVEALQSHLERMDVAIVLKPFDIDHLIRVIREALDQASEKSRHSASSTDRTD